MLKKLILFTTILIAVISSAQTFAQPTFCPLYSDFKLVRGWFGIIQTGFTNKTRTKNAGWGISGYSQMTNIPPTAKVIATVSNTNATCDYSFPDAKGTMQKIRAYHLNPDVTKTKTNPRYTYHPGPSITSPFYTCEMTAANTSLCPIELRS